MPDNRASRDESVESIEAAILSNIPSLLDSLLDSASLARPGFDAEDYAAALRSTAFQIDALARLVGAVAIPAQAEAVARISA
jgi:hypothetical protein